MDRSLVETVTLMSHQNSPPLAPYAVHDEHTLGRVHDESFANGLDGPFDIDRRRILSSTAFRRLQYKAQVFVNVGHDHFRTRLTHTLEVAEIARRLASRLRANEKLAEVIALTHDVGHPPFGHAGEAALSELMREAGGFEHNLHTLRVVDFLEHPFPGFRGLNLSFELREGLLKHRSRYDRPDTATVSAGADLDALLAVGPFPSLEGQIVCLADRLAYDSHDLEDAIGAGLVNAGDLRSLELWQKAQDDFSSEHANLPLAAIRRPILHRLVEDMIHDAVREIGDRLHRHGCSTVESVRSAPREIAAFSDSGNAQLESLERFLAAKVYGNPQVSREDAHSRHSLEKVFNYFLADPPRLPARYAARVEEQGRHRVVCDYVAGMTDRFCLHAAEAINEGRAIIT